MAGAIVSSEDLFGSSKTSSVISSEELFGTTEGQKSTKGRWYENIPFSTEAGEAGFAGPGDASGLSSQVAHKIGNLLDVPGQLMGVALEGPPLLPNKYRTSALERMGQIAKGAVGFGEMPYEDTSVPWAGLMLNPSKMLRNPAKVGARTVEEAKAASMEGRAVAAPSIPRQTPPAEAMPNAEMVNKIMARRGQDAEAISRRFGGEPVRVTVEPPGPKELSRITPNERGGTNAVQRRVMLGPEEEQLYPWQEPRAGEPQRIPLTEPEQPDYIPVRIVESTPPEELTRVTPKERAPNQGVAERSTFVGSEQRYPWEEPKRGEPIRIGLTEPEPEISPVKAAAEPVKPSRGYTDEEFRDYMRQLQEDKNRRMNDVRKQINFNGGRIETDKFTYIISKNVNPAEPEYPWRVTTFDKKGPMGHTVHKSLYGEGSHVYDTSAVEEVANNLPRREPDMSIWRNPAGSVQPPVKKQLSPSEIERLKKRGIEIKPTSVEPPAPAPIATSKPVSIPAQQPIERAKIPDTLDALIVNPQEPQQAASQFWNKVNALKTWDEKVDFMGNEAARYSTGRDFAEAIGEAGGKKAQAWIDIFGDEGGISTARQWWEQNHRFKRKAIYESDPQFVKEETIDALADNVERDIISIKDDLYEQGYTTEQVTAEIERIGKSLEAEKVPATLKNAQEEASQQLSNELFDTSKTFSLSGNQPGRQGIFTPPEVKGERLLEAERQNTDQLYDRLKNKAQSIFKNESGQINLEDVTKGARRVRDYVTIDTVPELTSVDAADSAVQHASARTSVPHLVNNLLSKVFPRAYKNPEVMSRTIDVLNKDNILGGYDEFLQRATKAGEEMDHKLAKRWNDAAEAIARKHDLQAYEAEVKAALVDPEISQNIQRWHDAVSPELDRLYNEVKAVDPTTYRGGRGRYFDTRINLLPKNREGSWLEAIGDETRPMPETSGASYRNPNAKRDPYDIAAKFTGEYSTDARAVLANVLGPRWNEATKIRFYNDLVKKGAARIAESGEATPQGFKRLPIKMPETNVMGHTRQVEKSLFVKENLVREIRDVLGTDQPLTQNAVGKVLTNIQLAQIADLVTHTKNIMTVVTKAQGAGDIWTDVVRKMPVFGTVDATKRIIQVTREVMADTPAIREEIAEMAKRGLVRPSFPLTGMQKITRGQQIIHEADTAARVIMNRFFDNLVERGLAESSEANRRMFVNQVGNYNKRLMGPLMRAASQSGLSPFIVAGRNFNRQGRWALTGNPGVKAASGNAAVKMRALNLLGTSALFTIPMMLNTLTTGAPGGRSGTPLGAWDLGTDEEDGRHKVVDLLQITGVRRGMRSIGIEAFVEGLRTGKDMNQIMGNALQDVGNAAIHPWMGPAPAFVAKTMTGRQLDMRGRMEAQKIPEGGGLQNLENFRAALESQNPLIYSLVKPAFSSIGLDQKPSEGYASEVGKTFLKSPYSAFGVRDMPKGTTAAEEMIHNINRREEGFRPEDAEYSKIKYKALDALRKNGGDWSSLSDDLKEQLRKLPESKLATIDKEAERTSMEIGFKRIRIDDALKIWKVATPEERELLADEMATKIDNHTKDMSDEDFDAFMKRLTEVVNKGEPK